MNIALITLGCPKNLVDAEVMLGLLAEAGHALVPDPDGADVAIVNTCSFIASAVDESTGVIRACLELKRAGRLGRVVVAGCMPQRYRESLFEMLPGVDGVVGCSDVDRIVTAISRLDSDASVAVIHEPVFLYDHTTPRVLGTPRHLAYVKISEGCDNRCAYCMIPSLRGRLRSRDPDSVRREVEELVSIGVREINLIAQDTTAYGTDIAPQSGLPELLAALDGTGADWIRILYTHPAHLTDAIIESVASCRSVVPYLDIPIQHVTDHILDAMGRRTDGSTIRTLLERVRQSVPGIFIRSSVIVGFPGENEADYEELRAFVAGGAIDHLGVFEFSPEHGTRAAALAGQVDRTTAAERARDLIRLTESLAVERGRQLVGRRLPVLVDETGDAELVGRHPGQAWELDGVVRAPAHRPVAPGEIHTVEVTGPNGYDLVGRLISGPGHDGSNG